MTKPPLLTNMYVSTPFFDVCVCLCASVCVCVSRYLCQVIRVYDYVCSAFDDGAGL